MTRFIIFLLLVYCGYLIWRYIKRKVLLPEQNRDTVSPRTPRSVAELVKDPQCGVYVVKDKAVKVRVGGEEIYFCSEACRSKYMERKGEELRS